MTKVLDASALLSYLEGEKGGEEVKKAVVTAAGSGKDLLMSVVNWGEVFYVLIRKFGKEKAEQVMDLIETLPVEIVPADGALARQAAVYKAVHKLPYADSFAAALAKIRGAELLTTDREFEVVSKEIRIIWL